MEYLDADCDKSRSAICGQIIKEALANRGLLDYEMPSQGARAVSQTSKAMAQELLARKATRSIQEQKLKLMNDLMEQLKSL